MVVGRAFGRRLCRQLPVDGFPPKATAMDATVVQHHRLHRGSCRRVLFREVWLHAHPYDAVARGRDEQPGDQRVFPFLFLVGCAAEWRRLGASCGIGT